MGWPRDERGRRSWSGPEGKRPRGWPRDRAAALPDRMSGRRQASDFGHSATVNCTPHVSSRPVPNYARFRSASQWKGGRRALRRTRAVGGDFPERRRRFRCRFCFRKSETGAMVFLSSSGFPRSWSAGRRSCLSAIRRTKSQLLVTPSRSTNFLPKLRRGSIFVLASSPPWRR